MPKPRVLHIIPNLLIGGAQRTVSTLRRVLELNSRVEITDHVSISSIRWSDVVVIHAWRERVTCSELNIPRCFWDLDEKPVIIFNHDWEGAYRGICDLVLVYSAYAAAHWTGPQPLSILQGGITLTRFLNVAQRRSWSVPATVGRLSTLHPGKISPETIQHWTQLAAKEFLIGGNGSQLQLLLETCTDPRFEFVGEVSPRLTHEFLSRVDIFLYDTEWHIESFCYTILEALAAGCVVVASSRGAIGELIENGKNGFLFDNHDEAIKLCTSLLGDSESCRVLSRSGVAAALRFPSALMQNGFTNHVIQVLRGDGPEYKNISP